MQQLNRVRLLLDDEVCGGMRGSSVVKEVLAKKHFWTGENEYETIARKAMVRMTLVDGR